MLVCKVIGCVISTSKDEQLTGKKLMIVQELHNKGTGKSLIAVDCVQSGIGDTVLVIHEGGASRKASGCLEGPVDCAIIGVVDDE